MDLVGIRARIDAIDRQLLELIDERLALAEAAARHKEAVRDPAREAEVLRRAGACAGEHLRPEFAVRLFAALIEESQRVQGR